MDKLRFFIKSESRYFLPENICSRYVYLRISYFSVQAATEEHGCLQIIEEETEVGENGISQVFVKLKQDLTPNPLVN